MKRSWWIQAVLYGSMIAAAIIVLRSHAMRPSVDIVGGLRFGVEVDVDAAATARLEVLSTELQRRLGEGTQPAHVTVLPGEGETLNVAFTPSSEHVRLSPALVDELGLAEVSRRPTEGRVVVRLSDASTRAAVERNTRTALERIHSRMDSACDWGGRVSREGNQIVVELPGIKTSEAERVRSDLGSI